jgi:hypothetical protein
VGDRDGETALDRDRDGVAVRRHRAGERDRAGCWSEHRLARLAGDVDTSMLTCGIRVGAEDERPQNRPAERPAPGEAGGREREAQSDNGSNGDNTHEHDLVVRIDNILRAE